MLFDRQTLEQIADWQKVQPIPVARAESLLEKLPTILGTTVTILHIEKSDTGQSNYDYFFVCAGDKRYGRLTGYGVFVSSLVPIVAITPQSVDLSPNSLCWSGIEPSDVIEPGMCYGMLPNALFALFAETEYRLLSRADALTKLPEGIQPYEYCSGEEPWDTVCHLLFANTD